MLKLVKGIFDIHFGHEDDIRHQSFINCSGITDISCIIRLECKL